MKLSFRQWLVAYLGGLGSGAIAWYLSGNGWIGVGVTLVFVAVYIFVLAGRAPAPPKSRPEPETRQQRRQARRAEGKQN